MQQHQIDIEYAILWFAPSGLTLEGGRETEEHGLLSLLCLREQQELPEEKQGDRGQHFSHKEPHLQELVLMRYLYSFSSSSIIWNNQFEEKSVKMLCDTTSIQEKE